MSNIKYHPITEDLKDMTVIQAIAEVVDISISKEGTNLNIIETLDYYAYVDLTKKEFGMLIAELQILHDFMKDIPKDTKDTNHE